jgi:hypothetical protein
MANNKNNEILDFLKNKPLSSSKEIYEGVESNRSYATIKRMITQLLADLYGNLNLL